MRKGKHAVLGLAALISAAAIGGTWASWTQELKAGNEFMTGSYNTSLDETFESPKNWKPGEKTEKAVQITNKGAVDAMAKQRSALSLRRRRRKDGGKPLGPSGSDAVQPGRGKMASLK